MPHPRAMVMVTSYFQHWFTSKVDIKKSFIPYAAVHTVVPFTAHHHSLQIWKTTSSMVRTRSHLVDKFLASLNCRQNSFTTPPIIDFSDEDSNSPSPPLPPPPVRTARPTRCRRHRSPTPVELEEPENSLGSFQWDKVSYSIFSLYLPTSNIPCK